MIIENNPLLLTSLVHPLEYQTEKDCQKSDLFNWMTNTLSGLEMKLGDLTDNLIGSYLVTRNTYPRLWNLFRLAMKRLDCRETVPLFIKRGYELDAEIRGSENDGSMIILNDACLKELEDDELLALLGMQVGRIKAGHTKNLRFLDIMRSGMDSLPVIGSVIGRKLYSYFSQRKIASGYTADRGGVIAAGSVTAVIRLIRKQIGADFSFIDPMILGKQPIQTPEKMGMYYIWLTELLGNYGSIERIRELRSWVYSADFKEKTPYLHYTTRLYFEDEGTDKHDRDILLLHKRAQNGNYIAMGQLGECYLREKNGLPADPYAGVSLLKEAAYHGLGGAMYLLYACAEIGIAGIPKDKLMAEQLLRAAGGRFDNARKEAAALEKLVKFKGADKAVQIVIRKNPGGLSFRLNTDAVKDKLTADECGTIRNAFWMPADDEIIAAELHDSVDGISGLVVSQTGIYGRLSSSGFPFFIRWQDYAGKEVYQMPGDDGTYFYCNDKPFYRCPSVLKGSIGELLVTIKLKLAK